MNKFMQLTKDFIDDEEGLTILEYVIGAALIVAAFVGAGGAWDAIKQKLDDTVNSL